MPQVLFDLVEDLLELRGSGLGAGMSSMWKWRPPVCSLIRLSRFLVFFGCSGASVRGVMEAKRSGFFAARTPSPQLGASLLGHRHLGMEAVRRSALSAGGTVFSNSMK